MIGKDLSLQKNTILNKVVMFAPLKNSVATLNLIYLYTLGTYGSCQNRVGELNWQGLKLKIKCRLWPGTSHQYPTNRQAV